MKNKTRIWLWAGATLVALVTLVLLIAPYAIRYGVTQWLERHGAQPVTLDDIDFNPITGILILHGLNTGAADAPTLTIRRAELRLAWLPLLHKQFLVTRLRFEDADLALATDTNGAWRIAGISPGDFKVSSDATPVTWQFGLERFEINRGTLRYRSPQSDASLRLERAEFDLTAQPDAAFATTPTPDRVRLRFRLQGKLDATRRQPNVRASTNWKSEGNAEYDPSTAFRWQITAKLGLSDAVLDASDRQLRFASVKNLGVEDIAIDQTWKLTARQVRLDEVALGTPTDQAVTSEPAVRAARVDLSNLRLAPGEVASIESITLSGARIIARRLEPDRWHVFDKLFAPLPDDAETAVQTPLPGLRVADLRLRDHAELTFEDRTFDPPFRTRAEISEARLERLDTDPNAPPSRFTVAGRIGKYSQFRVSGRTHPLAPQSALELTGEIRELDLPPWSPYAARELGYVLKSGHLRAGIELTVADGNLRGEGKFTLSNTEIASVNSEKVERLTEQLTVPLDTALTMLRDGKNNVQLNIAMTGALKDPKFDFSDAVKRGLDKALRTATVTYLKHYFQPYGSLITIAEIAGKAFRLKLDPVFFAPGASALDDAARTYLDRAAALMRDRPKMRIRLCGKAVPADGLGDKDSARALAEARAERIKAYLVTDQRTATDRLFICRPEVDDDVDAKARVELVL